MKHFWTEFKEGAISAVGMFGAIALTLFGILLVSAVIVAFAAVNVFNRLAGREERPHIPLDLSLIAICDTYDYWDDKITTAIKNLVK